MGKPWDVKASESVGKAIPNEFSKLSSWLKYIPYIGQALQALGAVDSGTTAYADLYDKTGKRSASGSLQHGMKSFSGGANPGIYGSEGKTDMDWADYLGQAGSLFNVAQGGGGYDDFLKRSYGIYGENTRSPYDPYRQAPVAQGPYWQDDGFSTHVGGYYGI